MKTLALVDLFMQYQRSVESLNRIFTAIDSVYSRFDVSVSPDQVFAITGTACMQNRHNNKGKKAWLNTIQ